MNAYLFLYFLLLGTSPLTVVPTTGHIKELIEKEQGRKGEREAQFELISKVNMFSSFVELKQCTWDKYMFISNRCFQ